VNVPLGPVGTQPCSAIAARQASPNRARRPRGASIGPPSRISLLKTTVTVVRSADHRSRGSSALASISVMISVISGSIVSCLSLPATGGLSL